MNYFLFVAAAIILICCIRCWKRGLLSSVFNFCGWIVLIVFIYVSRPYFYMMLSGFTSISDFIETRSIEIVTEKMDNPDAVEDESVFKVTIMPSVVSQEIENAAEATKEYVIKVTAKRLTELTLYGLASISSFIVGLFLLYILGKLIRAIGRTPGISSPNKLLGFLLGLAEGLFIIWIVVYLAVCFPTTRCGAYIVENTADDPALHYIYDSVLEHTFLTEKYM